MFSNALFLDSMLEESQVSDDIPTNFHMMKHINRSAKYSPPGAHVKGRVVQFINIMNSYKGPFHTVFRIYYELIRTLRKAFHRTNMTVKLHNHYPFSCLDSCDAHHVDTSLGHLQHYRRECWAHLYNCDEYKDRVVDTSIWKIKDTVIENSIKTLRILNLLFSTL